VRPAEDPVPADSDAEGTAALAATVERLREELDGLRQAMRSRAAIEQAKGMLMERHGIGPDEAFERLARLSQHANIKLVDVAAALVEVSLSDTMRSAATAPERIGPASHPEQQARTPADLARTARHQLVERWPHQGEEGEFGARVRAQGRRTRTRTELLAARAPRDLVTTVVQTALGDRPPRFAALALIDVNGVLSLVGWHGIPEPVAARWRRVPVDLPLAACVGARTGQAVWLSRKEDAGEADAAPGEPPAAPEPSREQADGGSALGLGIPDDDWSSAAVMPLLAEGVPLGVLALAWTEPHSFDAAAKSALEGIAAGVAVGVRRLPEAPPEGAAAQHAREGQDSALSVLDVIFHPVLLCVPVLEPDARISDLRVRHANPAAVEAAATGGEQLIGRRFLELWPDAVRRGLFAACLRVLEEGVQEDLLDHPWRLRENGRSRTGRADIRLTRYGGGVLITWTNVRAGGGS